MLHDIAPAAYNNDISFRAPVLEDKIIIYRGKQVLAFVEGDTMRAPLFADLFDESELEKICAIYLFAVGEDVYFMAEVPDETIDAVLARQPYDASSEMDGWAFLLCRSLSSTIRSGSALRLWWRMSTGTGTNHRSTVDAVVLRLSMTA